MSRRKLFWGTFLVLAGVLFLLQALGLLGDVKVFGAMVALLIIVGGVSLLLPKGGKDRERVWFSGGGASASADAKEYEVLFSNTRVVLPVDCPSFVKVDVVFGACELVLPRGRQVDIRCSAAFGAANLEGQQIQGFGERHAVIGEGVPVTIRADVAFGNLEVLPPPAEAGGF